LQLRQRIRGIVSGAFLAEERMMSLEDADDLPEPEELATDAIAELEVAVEELNAALALLENGYNGVTPRRAKP
jgi:hypothetical protein